MKPGKATLSLVSCALALALVGCGPSAAERAAKERERLGLEEQAQRDAKKANETITEMNQKLGRKPPVLDLGLSTQTEPVTPPSQPKP